MVRLEDGSQLSTMSEAKSGQCGVCGKNLNFKEEKVNDVTSTVAKHCGKIYTIGQSQSASVSATQDPEFKKKEDKLIESQAKANKLRRDGKAEEAAKLDEQNQRDAAKLAEEEQTDEPKTAFNPRAESSREEEKRGRR
jgi:hypothetical protein